MAGVGGNKKRYQYCTDSSGTNVYLRTLQGHSGRSLIDPTLQDNVVLLDGPVDPWTKTIRILIRSTWMNLVLHYTCTKHGKDIRIWCIGSTSTLLCRKDWSSIKHDRTLSFFTKHSQLMGFRRLLGWKLEKSHTKKYTCHFGLHQRSPYVTTGKIELGSEHAQRPERQDVQQSRSFQSNQPIPNQSRDRSEQPVVGTDRSGQPVVETSKTQTRSSDDSKSLNVETAHDGSGQPVVETNRKCARWLRNTFLSWKHETQCWRRNTSSEIGATRCWSWRFNSWANNDQRGEHGLPNSRVTTFCCEACAEQVFEN